MKRERAESVVSGRFRVGLDLVSIRRMTTISDEMYHVAMRCWLMRLCMGYLQFK